MRRRIATNWRWWMSGGMAVLALVAAGCGRAAPAGPIVPALGPGPEIALPIPGAHPIAPVIASRSPLLAVAFASEDSRGSMVYLAVSADNGASFSPPQPISREEGVDAAAPTIDLAITGADRSPASAAPGVRLSWRAADGRSFSRTVAPWRTAPPQVQPGGPALQPIWCDPSGAVLVAAMLGAEPVVANHGLADQSCAPGEVSGAADQRGWTHAAWVGRAEQGARVLFASSSDGQWFGGALALESGADPAHVALAIDPNQTAVAVWDEQANGRRHVLMQQALPAHHGPATLLAPLHLSGPLGGQRPAVAGIDGGVIVAWVDGATGQVAVRRVGLDALCAVEPPSEVQVAAR